MNKIIGKALTAVYRWGLLLSQASYRSIPGRIHRVNARVISVGDITWGATGKTPLVTKLARDLIDYDKKVAILTRGYGKDEVEELRRRLPDVPILVGRDRVKKAREAVEKYKAEVLLLDDGFQHIRLHRDLDVVNINSTLPFGTGALIPVGSLHEPLAHLTRAHLFMLTKSDIGSKNLHWIRQRLQEIKPDAVIFEAVHKPIRFKDFKRHCFLPLSEVKGKKVSVISGIGDPYAFEKSVENLGAEIMFAARFEDHHAYTEADLADFVRRSRAIGVKEAVTTEQDFCRIEPVLEKEQSPEFQHFGLLVNFDFLVLQIEFQVIEEEEFIRRCLNP